MNKCTKVTLKQDNSDRINSLRRRIEVLEDRQSKDVMAGGMEMTVHHSNLYKTLLAVCLVIVFELALIVCVKAFN